MRPFVTFAFPFGLILLFAGVSSGDQQPIRFDLAPTSEAIVVKADPFDSHRTLVSCEFRLSSLIADSSVTHVDQWIVRCQPAKTSMRIADYAPRTEVASDIDGPIQIKSTNESTQAMGLGIDGHYAKSVSGNIGADVGSKQTESRTFNRIAPVQAVTVSGTFDRGRGVYFKLRSTSQQVLEGEKVFRLTFLVPKQWRSGMINISVTAESTQRSFPTWESRPKSLAMAQFAVAAYRRGDHQAATLAMDIANAEYQLREISSQHAGNSEPPTLPSMLRHVAAKLDLDSPPPNNRWIETLIAGQIDPYIDSQISRLPMDVRMAVIDYHDSRTRFTRLNAVDVSGLNR